MKKLRIILILQLLISASVIAQITYGVDVENHDVRIIGKLHLDSGDSSIYIGKGSGTMSMSAPKNTVLGYNAGQSIIIGRGNSVLGYMAGSTIDNGMFNAIYGAYSGMSLSTGSRNTLIGSSAGQQLKTGVNNVLIGNSSGGQNNNSFNTIIGAETALLSNGKENSMIGESAGRWNTGNRNVIVGRYAGTDTINTTPIDLSNSIFIGYHAGGKETESNRLYIENSDSSTPLIYGEFDTNVVQINGTLNISEVLKLTPQSAPSGSCSNSGDILYGDDDELYLCKAGTWKKVMTN